MSHVGNSEGLLLLEHLNLTVANNNIANAFYIHGLGCKMNAVRNSQQLTHVNLGLSQFHLPKSSSKNTAQIWNGIICLHTLDDLREVRDRLLNHSLLSQHGVTASIVRLASQGSADSEILQILGPYGNHFQLRRYTMESHYFCYFGHHLGFSDRVVSMPKIIHYCQPGSASTSSIMVLDKCKVKELSHLKNVTSDYFH